MKKIMLTLVAVFMISMATYAQSDTTTTAKQVQKKEQQIPKGYSVIKVDDVPTTLRTTLGDQEYVGWESGYVYQNPTNQQYLVRIGTGANVKSYYFDNAGKRVKDPKQE
jgi:hypothetical protein